MNNSDTDKQKKRLHMLAMANAAIWVIALVANIILLQGSGNPKGMFILLAAGTGLAVQMIASISKLN